MLRRSLTVCNRLYYPNHTFISKDNRRINHQWLPRRLLLVRHGESTANVDREVYSKTPDWRIPLTSRGREQAFDCGKRLRSIIKNEKLYIYYSPYLRTRQTLEEIRRSLDDSLIQGEREDERLREQEMGNYQPMVDMDKTWASRNEFSRLYYRFPSGESGADVGDRVSSFFDSLLRERIGLTVPNMNERVQPDAKGELEGLGLGRWCSKDPLEGSRSLLELPSDRSVAPFAPHHATSVSDLGNAEDRGVLPPNDHGAGGGDDQNVVIVSHGLLIRLFIGRWFRVPMEVFETMLNPPNCAIIVLERNDEIGRLIMTDVSKQLFGSDPLLQMMRFDGREDSKWYRERFLGIIDPEKEARDQPAEDDDENHYSKSAAHNTLVGAPAPPAKRAKPTESSSPCGSLPAEEKEERNPRSASQQVPTQERANPPQKGNIRADDLTSVERERLSRWLSEGDLV